jgi:hypothetical protein
MGLVILVTQTEAEKASALNGQITLLCEAVVVREGHLTYIPLSGKLIELLKILRQNNVNYHLENEPR